jgi:hypothetical protein
VDLDGVEMHVARGEAAFGRGPHIVEGEGSSETVATLKSSLEL